MLKDLPYTGQGLTWGRCWGYEVNPDPLQPWCGDDGGGGGGGDGGGGDDGGDVGDDGGGGDDKVGNLSYSSLSCVFNF